MLKRYCDRCGAKMKNERNTIVYDCDIVKFESRMFDICDACMLIIQDKIKNAWSVSKEDDNE